MNTRRIYLDHASAMPVRPEAEAAMTHAAGHWANPGALHAEGVAAKAALEDARATVALELAVKPREVIFTSGLTESNNLAILGFAHKMECQGETLTSTHWITSSIEHDAVLESFAEVERRGGTVTHVDPDTRGLISAEAVARAVRPETVLVSIGWANSEIGVVEPIREISRAVRAINAGVVFHTDAGQAPLFLHPHVHTLGVDLLSLGANKVGGPHGIGALYVSNRARLRAVSFGGRQERQLRAGTENVVLACGFAAALAAAGREREVKRRIAASRDALLAAILDSVPGSVVNGSVAHALPHMFNLSIPRVSTEYVMFALDAAGIAVSTKSACREGESPESHVVKALGGEEWRAAATLRFSLGEELSPASISHVADTLERIISDPACRLH